MAGRPKLQLNETDIHDLAAIGCTQDEICSLLGCNPTTLRDKYSAVYEKGNNVMRESIRRKRLKIAMDDTHKMQASMLMFLSKVVLGEKEYSVIDSPRDTPEDSTITFVELPSNK